MRALVAFALVGCGGGELPYRSDAGAVDAGVDAGEDAGPVEPARPAPPSMPADPLAGGTFLVCAPGFRPLEMPVGPPGCEPDPDACPAGDFAEDVPKGEVVVDVRLGVDSLADAVAAAPEGAVLRLSKGTLNEDVGVDRPVTLWGACPAETRLARTVTLDNDAALQSLSSEDVVVRGSNVRLESMAVTGETVVSGSVVAGSVYAGFLRVSAGASAELRESSFTAIHVDGAGAQVNATRLLVTHAELAVTAGGYLLALDLVVDGPVLSIGTDSRADVARGRIFGYVTVGGPGAVFVGIDVTSANLLASFGADLQLNRARLEGGALMIRDPETHASATDVTLTGGGSIEVERSTLELTRAVVDGSAGRGILADGAASFTGSDLQVLGSAGFGIEVFSDAVFYAERVLVERATGCGVCAFRPSARATLRDLLVEPTLQDGAGAGAAIAAVDGAVVDVRGFRVSSAAVCGVLVFEAEMDLANGEVSSNPVGASVQAPGFDRARLEEGVVYRGNEVDFDTSYLPVPEPVGGL